jgi:alpha-tubulin suppressor-like RCC1 family protein
MKSHKFDMLGQIDALNKPITFISKSGYNSQFIIIDNILYSASGNSASWTNYTTGRGSDNQNPFYGLDNFKRVPIPSSSPIVEAGGGYIEYGYVLLEDGDLYTWGANNRGACGLGHTTNTPIPTLAAEDVTNVYSHPSNGCYAINDCRLFIKKTDGYIYGCGDNGYGALGLNDTTDRDEFTKITALGTTVESFWNMGSLYGCSVAQKTDKSIWLCGYNGYGQLGTGDTGSLDEFTDLTSAWPGDVGEGADLINVIGQFGYHTGSAYSYSSLGMLFDDGADTLLRMSGYNAQGQLGDTTLTQRTSPVTPNVGSGRIDKIAGMGGVLTVNCLKEDGNLLAWGYNNYGQVGDGSTNNRSTPAVVESNVEDIFSDGMDLNTHGYMNQSFIKKTDKQLYGCGYNTYYSLGLGNNTNPITSHTRVLMPYDEEVVDIGHYCTTGSTRIILFRTLSNNLYACGYNVQYGIKALSTVGVYVPTQIRLPEVST